MEWKSIIKNKLFESSFWKVVEFLQGLQYSFNYWWYYKTGFLSTNSTSIREINIEFSNQCNLRCKFCALDHDKPAVYMQENLLRQFFENLLSDKRFSKVETLQLYNAGETLLHPKVVDLLKVVKEYKQNFSAEGRKFPEVHIVTNAMLLREKLSKAIIDLKVVDVLRVSMDGGCPEDFEQMRTRAKWLPFYNNVKFFHQYNRETNGGVQLRTITIVPDDKPLSLDWMETEFREILELADSYELRRLHNWGGEIEGIGYRAKTHKTGCNMAMQQMVLLPNGDFTICCNDLNSKGVVGNLLQSNLYEVYKSAERIKYLDLLYEGKKEELELCRECETY